MAGTPQLKDATAQMIAEKKASGESSSRPSGGHEVSRGTGAESQHESEVPPLPAAELSSRSSSRGLKRPMHDVPEESQARRKRPMVEIDTSGVPSRLNLGYLGRTPSSLGGLAEIMLSSDEAFQRFKDLWPTLNHDYLNHRTKAGEIGRLMALYSVAASGCALNLLQRACCLEDEVNLELEKDRDVQYSDSQRELKEAQAEIAELKKYNDESALIIPKAVKLIRKLQISMEEAEQKGFEMGLQQPREVDCIDVVRDFLRSPVYDEISLRQKSGDLNIGFHVALEQLKHLKHLSPNFSEPLLDPYKNGDLTVKTAGVGLNLIESNFEGREFSEILDEVELWAGDAVKAKGG